jgi:molybdopterin synthase sulfur carrier subunit
MQLVYFARVRELVGYEREEIALPPAVQTVADLIAHLVASGENYAQAFAEPDTIRVAVDQQHSETNAALSTAREVAFFPPMTGG